MQIKSTILSPTKGSGQPAGGVLRNLDQQLAKGVVPEDLFISSGEQPRILSQSGDNRVALTDGSDRVAKEKRRELGSLAVLMPMCGITGAMLGAVGVPGNPLMGMGIGALAGAAIGYDVSTQSRGQIAVNHNGSEVKRKWHGSPDTHLNTAQELRTKLHAVGALGNDIEPVSELLLGPINESLKEHQDSLRALAGERRLLADFGGKTRYGQPALQLVGSATAAKLLSNGKELYVADVKEVTDTPRQLSSEATSTTLHQKKVELYHYLERNVEFELQQIKNAPELKSVGSGKGLPETLSGLPKNSNNFQQNVYTKTENGERKITREAGDEITKSFTESLLSSEKVDKPSTVGHAINHILDPSTRGFMMAGGAAGVLAGFAIPGFDPAAAATVGAIGGHFIGRASIAAGAASKPEATNTQNKNFTKNVATGLGAAAGAGLGVLAAMQTGDAGMISAIGVGAIGGAFTGGVLRKGSADSRLLAAQGGFCAGAAVGIAHHFLGLGPMTALALAPLGAVAGGTIARMASK